MDVELLTSVQRDLALATVNGRKGLIDHGIYILGHKMHGTITKYKVSAMRVLAAKIVEVA